MPENGAVPERWCLAVQSGTCIGYGGTPHSCSHQFLKSPMSEQTTDTLQITGMSCGHCVRTVQEALEDAEGVEVLGVEVGSARVRYDPEQVPRERLVEAVEGVGFGVQQAA